MQRRNVLLVCLLALITWSARSQQTEEQFNLPVRYLLSLPEGYDSDTAKRWPLLIFLHGSGESGEDLKKVKVHGPPKLIDQGKKFNFIVVSPQAAPQMGWQPEILEHFLRSIKRNYRVDKDRIYLTGLSMGGFGTWNWASKYPQNFAAIAPICGGGDTAEVSKLKNLPIWCFHGGKDEVVRPQESIRMIEAARKYNPSARLTIYPEAGHDSWTETYNNDSLYTWLLSQKRKSLVPLRLESAKLAEYAGAYVRNHDTVRLVINNGKLLAKTGGPEIEVHAAGADQFFIMEGDMQLEITFFRNRKGEISRFVFYGNREMSFDKVKNSH